MSHLAPYFGLIPIPPLAAAGLIAVASFRRWQISAGLAIAAMAASLVLALSSFGQVSAGALPLELKWEWFSLGNSAFSMGMRADGLAGVVGLMVAFVALLIFIYSAGYMSADPNAGPFFCFLSLFAAAMLGLVYSNNLLLLFICWEIVGLASFLLIGFWFEKPAAVAAARKAFLTTRVADLGFFLGLLWLYRETGTLMLHDNGQGCLDARVVESISGKLAWGGIAASAGIGLLLFWGAMGKSGQVPLHVWLPDAMEGPTPVSALIHAATMVAAGVFLIARIYPLLGTPGGAGSPVLQIIAWIGAITAVFGALCAVAQFDIKRILAFSTISQLGYMMMALGIGGVAAAIFHLVTHAFFKALLFLGAGSVIHGTGEQDIRRMGGLRGSMPATFLTYSIGMMALAGVPIFFSGFWSKDEILHAAFQWPVSRGPFWLGLSGVFLTAFYMTRQMVFVFYGPEREAHESPRIMTGPLWILAAGTIGLSVMGTPAWPRLQEIVEAKSFGTHWDWSVLSERAVWLPMALSTGMVLAGILVSAALYSRMRRDEPEWLARSHGDFFDTLNRQFYFNEFYAISILPVVRSASALAARFDAAWVRAVETGFGSLGLALGWLARFFDEWIVNALADAAARGSRALGLASDRWQEGTPQQFLRIGALGVALLILLLTWGCRVS